MNIKLQTRNKARSMARWLLSLATTMSFAMPRTRKKIPILVYHRVAPLFFKKELPYANVYPDNFLTQMQYLSEHFDVISLSAYLQRIKDNNIRGNEVCITFDDGFRDNYLYAYPILKKLNLKATFFLTTKFIGSGTLFPWMALDQGAHNDLIVNRVRWLPLTWEDVQEMMKSGMEFGTHTHTHQKSLSKLRPEFAEEEIVKCTEAFHHKTGQAPRLFSYPHGTFMDYDQHHIGILKRLNYVAAVTTNIGRNTSDQDPYQLKRIIIYEEDSLWEFRKKVHGAYDIAEQLQKMWLTVAGAKPYEVLVK